MIYVVKSGDTLAKIADRLTLSKSYYIAIANLNNIANVNLIKIGQKINIPDNWLKGNVSASSNTVNMNIPLNTGVIVENPQVLNTPVFIPDSGFNNPIEQIPQQYYNQPEPTNWLLYGGIAAALVFVFITMTDDKKPLTKRRRRR